MIHVSQLSKAYIDLQRGEFLALDQLSFDAQPGQVYGLAYKDAPEATRAFLAELGNPFETIGVDRSGQGGLDFGLTGVPETFVISPDGQIILHVRGPLDAERREEVSEALSG